MHFFICPSLSSSKIVPTLRPPSSLGKKCPPSSIQTLINVCILTAFDNYDDYQGAYSADPFPTLTFPIARPQKTCPDLLLQLGITARTNSTRHHSE